MAITAITAPRAEPQRLHRAEDTEGGTMLILERTVGDGVVIDTPQGRVKVRVKSLSGNRVRIRIDAPRVLEVDREEVRRAKDAARRDGGRDVDSHSADPAAG